MVISIDETGDFSPKSNYYHFFSAVHIPSRNSSKKIISKRFNEWEATLPRSLKNHNGEIKSSKLNEKQLYKFIEKVLLPEPSIVISSLRFNPVQNPYQIVDKHKQIQQLGINDGILQFTKVNRPHIVKTIRDFSFWFRKLSYTQFIKIELLGIIIYESFKNTIGTSIVRNIDEELLDLSILIDQIFLKGLEQNTFWHELLRNQIYFESVKNPLPFLVEWDKTGHPFIDKYTNDKGILDFNDLFWNNCQFVKSHIFFEIRIADTVNTILSNYYNRNSCSAHFKKLIKLIIPKGNIKNILFNDFDIEKAIAKKEYNPWEDINRFRISKTP